MDLERTSAMTQERLKPPFLQVFCPAENRVAVLEILADLKRKSSREIEFSVKPTQPGDRVRIHTNMEPVEGGELPRIREILAAAKGISSVETVGQVPAPPSVQW